MLAVRAESRRISRLPGVGPPKASQGMLIVAGPTGVSAHDGGTLHPEQQGRIFSVMDGVRDLDLEDGIRYVGVSRGGTRISHSGCTRPKYLDGLESFCRQGGGDIDPDTYARTDSFSAARRAAGAGLEAIRAMERAR